MYTREKEGVRGQEERSIAALVVTLRSFYRYARSIIPLCGIRSIAVHSIATLVRSLRLVYRPASQGSFKAFKALRGKGTTFYRCAWSIIPLRGIRRTI
jgi:hypothetical protein